MQTNRNPWQLGSDIITKMLLSPSRLFLDSLTIDYSKKNLVAGVFIFILTFVIFANVTTAALINGDAAVYASQISNYDFSQRTIHIGYYLLGGLFSSLFPFLGDYTLNVMSSLFGALTVTLIYFMGFTISGKHTIGLVSSMFLATNFILVLNSLYAEVYIVQTFFIILAIQLWLLNYSIGAGLALSMAFLVTPSSLFALVMLPILRPQAKSLRRFALAFGLTVFLVLVPHWNDYLFGGRSVLNATQQSVSITDALIKEGEELIRGMFLALPFLVLGIMQLVKQKQWNALGLSIGGIWVVNLLFGERFQDVPVQLPTYILLSLVAGLGFGVFQPREMGKRLRLAMLVMPAFVVAVNSVLLSILMTNINKEILLYRDTVLQIEQVSQPNYLVIGDWDRAMLFRHYISEGDQIWWIFADQFDTNNEWGNAEEIWVLGNYPDIFRRLRAAGYVVEPFGGKHVQVYKAYLQPKDSFHKLFGGFVQASVIEN